MANIGASAAFYRVGGLTRANNNVNESMTRLSTGKANANAETTLHMCQWERRL